MTDQFEIHEQFFTGRVLEVGKTEVINEFGFDSGALPVRLETNEGKEILIEQPVNLDNPSDNLAIKTGDELVLVGTQLDGELSYAIQEPYRLDGIISLFIAFVLLAIFIAGKKGLLSMVGLAISLLILINWLIPQIIAGNNPILASFFAAVAIAIVTFYLSHGFQKRTTLALISTLFTLVLAFVLSLIAVHGIDLFGTGSEDAIALNFGSLNPINLRGLLLGAIVIGTLGVLDDVTITQVGAVHEIHKANKTMGYKELYQSGISIGKDHIASIINTLALAYAGASFPVLMILVASPRPLWISLNSEPLAEEIVRTLVGSMTLIVAIPIATLLAAYYYSGRRS